LLASTRHKYLKLLCCSRVLQQSLCSHPLFMCRYKSSVLS